MLERLKSLSPLRYEWYRSEAQVFFDQLSLFTSDELRFMNDSYYEVLGENCSLEQVALQQERGFIGDPTFFVNLPRWNRFDLNSRAALIVHEIIYNEFLLYGHTDSVSARRMVAFLASNYFRHHYLKNFLVDLHSAKIPDTDIGGIWVRLWDFATDEDPLRSKKLKPADENLIQSVLAEAYPNFEPSNYSLPNLFVQMRTYNPFYVVNNSHIRVLAERSQQLLPIEITFNHDQKISSLRTREPTNGPATLWLQHADQSWQQVHELSWDDAGILTLAR
ncbi:MAG: hypothetical protein JST16_12500 [Bdellovibrionales bacterium]|nr:hypothetical protein [Bdellovibrionales bacterium]